MTTTDLEGTVAEAMRAFKTDESYAVSIARMAVTIVRKRAAGHAQAAKVRQTGSTLCSDVK